MPTLNLSESVEKGATDLRSLRRLINGPTQRVVDDLQQRVKKINADLYTPEELTKLLVPIISEVLQHRIATTEKQVAATLAPIIDKVFAERTQQDKSAIVNALAPTVAKSLRERHEKHPDEVAEDLAPLMGSAIREQVRLQRDVMVDALYPIIGATIAKYMAEALRQLTENVNKKIERTFSLGGLMRKARAKVSGVSEAELILGESLPFSVDAVFLIQKKSGLLITEAHKDGAHYDTDLVSGMLTAIRSFVNEWIARAGEISEIDAIEYGRSKIMLEVAGHCYLAAVIEGEPPPAFVYRMRETVARIISESDREIAAFQGEFSGIPTAVHERIASLVAPGVVPQAAVSTRPSLTRSLIQIGSIVLLLVAIPLGWHLYRQHENRKMEAATSSAIASSLGFAVSPVAVQADGDEIRLTGRLPNALLRNRAFVAARTSAPSATIDNTIALAESPSHPAVIVAEIDRVTAAFNRLADVNIGASFKDGAVTLQGTVTDKSLERKVIAEIERIPGVASIASSFKNTLPTIEEVIYFIRSTDFTEDAVLKLRSISHIMEQFPNARLRIIGYSDASGSAARNIPLSLARAVAVRDALVGLGVNHQRLEVEGDGKPFEGIDPLLPENRCVRFQVLLQQGVISP